MRNGSIAQLLNKDQRNSEDEDIKKRQGQHHNAGMQQEYGGQ